jgi:epoxyqueuosine reductase QueG
VAEEGAYPDLVAAARGAGLGWPSRLGLLLHPERGPWWSLRAALLTDAPLAVGAPLASPPPCAACEAPCTRVCPGAAPGPGGFDVGRCGAVRARDPRCAERCDARRACPVGAAHRYAAGDEAAGMRASQGAMAVRARSG